MRLPRHLIILALLTAAGLSLALMQTLVVPALPTFQREFDAPPTWTAWIVTGFLLSSSILTPIIGKLGDAYGKKRLLVISLAVFGLGSLGAAAAWSLGSLVAFRVVQGVGAALFPLSFGIIRDEFPPEKVAVGIGTVSSVFGLGGGVGLVLSGVILEHLSWRWLFVIGSLPVLAAIVLIARHVPESRVKTPARPDYVGSLVLSLALGALLIAVSEGGAWGWSSARVIGLLALAAAATLAWIRIERVVAEPLVDLRTLARRGMAATNGATLLLGFAMTAFFVLIPSFVQAPGSSGGFDASPTEAGLSLLPFSAAMMVGGPLGGRMIVRRGPEWVLRLGLGLAAGSLAGMAVAHEALWILLPWLAGLGLGGALALGAIGTLVLAHSSAAETGVATGMNSIMRTAGASFGAQVAAAVVAANVVTGSALPLERGFTLGLAIAAGAAVLALAPTLAFSPASRDRSSLAPAPAAS